MSTNELLVLTFVLQESDKNTFNNLIDITKKYLFSLDINLKKTSTLKKNKAIDFYFIDSVNNFKLTNLNLGKDHSYDLTKFRNTNFLQGRGSLSSKNSLLVQPTLTNKVFSSAGANSKILLSDQSVRQYEKLSSTSSNYNLSEGTNPLTSNMLLLNKTNPSSSITNNYLLSKSNHGDLAVLNHTLSSRYYMEGTHYPNSSNNPAINRIDHSTMNAESVFFDVNRNSITKKSFTKNLDTVDLLQGAREKAPASINSAY